MLQDAYAAMRAEATKVLVGQEQVFELLVVSLLAGGHVLLEGVPGTAKTLAAKTLATLVSGRFQRVQFTPDLLPSDILGTNVFHVGTGEFKLRQGPIFCEVLLADEHLRGLGAHRGVGVLQHEWSVLSGELLAGEDGGAPRLSRWYMIAERGRASVGCRRLAPIPFSLEA